MHILNKVINILISVFAFFIFAFIWANYYVRDYRHAFNISVLVTSLFFLGYTLIYNYKSKKSHFSKIDAEQIDKCSKNILLQKASEQLDFFARIFEKNNTLTKHKYYLKFENPLQKNLPDLTSKENIDAYSNAPSNKKAIIIPIFNKLKINEDDIINILNKIDSTSACVIVFCNEYVPENPTFFNQIEELDLEVLNIKDIYKKYLQPQNIYPKCKYSIKNNSSIKYSQLIFLATKQEKAKNYFFIAIILMFFSLFTRYSIYYIISGTLLLILAFLCQTNVLGKKMGRN